MTTSTIRRGVSTTPAVKLSVKVRKTLKRPQFWFGLLVLVPTAAWYIVFAYRPILMAFRMAVVDYRLLDPAHSPWVGLKNFNMLFHYNLFWIAVGNTLKYALFNFLAMLPVAMLLSYCLVNVIHGRPIYQWALFVPVVVSIVAVALLFRMLMDPQVGTINYILKSLGLPTSRWLTGPESAMYSVVLVDVWKGMGTYIVLLTAGLLNIPQEMYDAAKVDGANAWQTFWQITIPLLSYTLTLVIVLLAIASLQVYTSALVMTGGGPGRVTYMINLLIVEEAFTNFRFGLATSASLVLFAAILIVTAIQLRLTRAGWQY
jgi:multiple sugar transport system permease protein/alpha-1,4-digalacturonate transport system permease protein